MGQAKASPVWGYRDLPQNIVMKTSARHQHTRPLRESSSIAAVSRWGAIIGLMLMFFIISAIYYPVNWISAARGVTVFDPASLFVVNGRSLDSQIPYLPWTILIYKPLFGGFFWLTVFVYPKTASGARELFQLYRGVVVITLVASVVFLLCPAEMTLRLGADYQGDSTEMHTFNQNLHLVDSPFNTWPCLHVAHTGLIALVTARWLGSWRWTVLVWIAWTVLAISTLTTKQHYIWDIITGLPLALGYWHWKLRPRSTGDHA